MAPSRKKGANKAAAAAAALRKWKVGDLVLAKVKGFPAWPATVSDPGKWGYAADWKKVVVHFFGTEQIAFCNPADVEEFTEEKKVSLLGRRHGKGADFVRAVNEIIDCFEKLRKQDQVNKLNETGGINCANENIGLSLTESVDDDAVAPAKQLCTGITNDLNSLTEAAMAVAAEDALLDKEMRLNEATSNQLSTETLVPTTYLTRNKSDVARPQRNGSRRRKSTRLLRSSSRIDASRPRSAIMPSTINTWSSRRSGANVSEDRSLRRSKRIVKSSDGSVGEDVNSRAFVSSDSIEQSDSETMTVNSDTLSNNYVSTGDSGYKAVGLELFTQNIEVGTELSDKLDFQSNNAVIKRKRKPNRKRHNNDTVEAAKPDLVASDIEIVKNACVSPTFSEKSTQKYVKDDGDEHLPLVKRARVRMGMPSPTTEEVTLVHEEKMLEAPGSLVTESFEPLSCQVDHADTESVPIREDPAISSPSQGSPGKKHIVCETRKNYLNGESSLPPSKRLHRALEAMSANVAEDCERAPTSNIQSNGHCPSFSECSELLTGNGAKVELESESIDNLRNVDLLLNASESCIMPDVINPKNDSETDNVLSKCVITHGVESTEPDLCRGSFECVEGADTKHLKLSTLIDTPAETDAALHVKLDSLDSSEQSTHLNCNTAGMMISSADCCKTVCSDLTEVAEKDISQIDSDSKCVEEMAGGSPNTGTRVQLDSADGEGETNKTKHLLLPENNLDSNRPEFVEEARSTSLGSNIMYPEDASVKTLNSGHRHSVVNSTSISFDHVEDRTVSVTHNSSSLTDGARASPLNSSFGHLVASDNKNSLENYNSSSPDVQSHLEKAKLAGKSASKGESLSSFEAIIRSLTRTKESIGRATRIAIDCAKLGFATKVVEILARNLECESSLHKKIDLFFLVDSITQCSRGIKGDGGVYPSAIQALLPRLLLAAAPPGSSSHENHRQCLKVLRVWQERKILPEPIIRHHIRELDVLCDTAATASFPIVGSQRPLRNERAFDDPIREMEGMLVDEYGSNSSIQIHGFCMPRMLRDVDGGSDSDGEGFEAVTPEHSVEDRDGEKTLIPAVEKRSHILEDVDGELEMEDVAPCCEGEIASTSNMDGADHPSSNHLSDNHYGSPSTPQQPKDLGITSASLSSSTLPLAPPPPPRPHHTLAGSAFPDGVCNSVPIAPDSKPYSSCQESNNKFSTNRANQTVLPRVKPTNTDSSHHRVRENKDFESHMQRQLPDSSSVSYSDRPPSHLSGRALNSSHRSDSFNKGGFHLRPPHPAPSNQFSYVHDQRIQSRRDFPPPSHSNRYHARNAENGNFYKDRSRNKFVGHDNIGECWRHPFPSISGPCYPDDARMGRSPMSYSGPPRESPYPDNRWDFPPRPMNHRHFNYRPSSEGPVPVANRGPLWRPR